MPVCVVFVVCIFCLGPDKWFLTSFSVIFFSHLFRFKFQFVFSALVRYVTVATNAKSVKRKAICIVSLFIGRSSFRFHFHFQFYFLWFWFCFCVDRIGLTNQTKLTHTRTFAQMLFEINQNRVNPKSHTLNHTIIIKQYCSFGLIFLLFLRSFVVVVVVVAATLFAIVLILVWLLLFFRCKIFACLLTLMCAMCNVVVDSLSLEIPSDFSSHWLSSLSCVATFWIKIIYALCDI